MSENSKVTAEMAAFISKKRVQLADQLGERTAENVLFGAGEPTTPISALIAQIDGFLDSLALLDSDTANTDEDAYQNALQKIQKEYSTLVDLLSSDQEE